MLNTSWCGLDQTALPGRRTLLRIHTKSLGEKANVPSECKLPAKPACFTLIRTIVSFGTLARKSKTSKSRSSSREVRTRVQFFSVVYFSRGTLPQKRAEKGHLAGGPRLGRNSKTGKSHENAVHFSACKLRPRRARG